MVWDETVKIVDSLFSDIWGNKEVITTDHCVEITLPVSNIFYTSSAFSIIISSQIALFVIGVAGKAAPVTEG